MTTREPGSYAVLEERIGHSFANRSLCEAALTHKSWLNEAQRSDRTERAGLLRRLLRGRRAFSGDLVGLDGVRQLSQDEASADGVDHQQDDADDDGDGGQDAGQGPDHWGRLLRASP